MSALTEQELRHFHNSLSPEALSNTPEDQALYVADLHQSDEDPISSLATTIKWNENRSGAYLFTGMPGTGKTTELYRLVRALESNGHVVLLMDGLEYISPTTEVEISDFLIAILIGFADQLDNKFQYKLFDETYADRFKNFMQSEVNLAPELSYSHSDYKAALKLTLRQNIALKKTLQAKLQASLATLFELISDLIEHALVFVRPKIEAKDGKVILLVDSLEKMHGDGIDSGTQHDPVLASLKRMVSQYAQQLFISSLHVVYSVPPYLLKLAPTLGNQVDYVCHLTSGHILQKRSETPDMNGLQVFRTILSKRYADWTRLIATEQLNELILHSGGDLREFFRLVRRVITLAATRSANTQTAELVASAIQAQRRDYLPLPDDAKTRLRYARQYFEPFSSTEADLDLVMRDLYLRRLLMYRNGEDWYMPHPLLWQELTPPVEK